MLATSGCAYGTRSTLSLRCENLALVRRCAASAQRIGQEGIGHQVGVSGASPSRRPPFAQLLLHSGVIEGALPGLHAYTFWTIEWRMPITISGTCNEDLTSNPVNTRPGPSTQARILLLLACVAALMLALPAASLATIGDTWTRQTTAASNKWNSVAFGNGVFVAVAGEGTGNRVITSPDGITWTTQDTTVWTTSGRAWRLGVVVS